MTDGSTSAQSRFRLAIVGGGIAGLALAVTLGQYEDPMSPILIDLYEAGPEITTVGAGISVWPRTWEVMRYLGLYDQLASEAVKAGGTANDGQMKPAFIYRKSDWQQDGYDFGRVLVPNGSTTMHRAEMVDVFMRNFPASCSIHTSKRLLDYTELSRNGVKVYMLHFTDGTTAEADVIIGADGIKSKTRAAMYNIAHKRDCALASTVKREDCERCKAATPKWTGIVTYRTLIPSESLREINPDHRVLLTPALLSYSGRRKHIITYPISHGKYINFVGFVTTPEAEGTTYPHKWVTDAGRDEFIAHYEGWEPEVEQMFHCVQNPTLWAIHVVEALPFSVDGRVALMGDAVHAMAPHFGAGGGQAIEDAFILGRLLADGRTSLAHVPAVMKIYQDVRLPFAQDVVRKTGNVGHMYEFDWPGLYDGSPVPASSEDEALEQTKEKLDEVGRAIEEQWEWQVKEKVEHQWKAAERLYEDILVRGHIDIRPAKQSLWKMCTFM